ncbi:MAG: hypothetical protein Q9170_008379 [Blastenia crenularia]
MVAATAVFISFPLRRFFVPNETLTFADSLAGSLSDYFPDFFPRSSPDPSPDSSADSFPNFSAGSSADSSLDASSTYSAACISLLDSLNSLEPVPYTVPPAYNVHRAALKELYLPGMLTRITDAYAEVNSTLAITGQQFVEFVDNITWSFTSSATSITLRNVPHVMHTQLRQANVRVKDSLKLYDSLKSDYDALYETTPSAKPGLSAWFWIYLGDEWWLPNGTERVLVPYELGVARRDKAQAAIKACGKELSRLA